ncbi:methyltransferase regulatory domain-containing protein [Nannocystaceae bacterium ST9]
METTYDEVPYPSYAYPQTHPDRLHVIGRLFGLDPAPITRCRVLELGCAGGGNLMPMAELLPDSEFVGIDRSSVQIGEGRALAERLGLGGNLRLEVRDLLELDPAEFGRFDYVICHGVFSWVPREVQDRILALLPRLLREQGLAFVSYNTYPGWHLREGVRRMMMFHTRQFAAPSKKVEQARALVEFLAGAVPERASPYAIALTREHELISRMNDPHVFHEQLERENSPMYFYEFIERLAPAHQAAGLQYLADTDLHWMVGKDLPDEVHATLARITSDHLALEQYLDFVRNRQFRTSVLCRAELKPRWRIEPPTVFELRFGFERKQAGEIDLRAGVEVEFETREGVKIQTAAPLTKAALAELGERWPRTLPLDPLIDAAEARLASAEIERPGEPLPRRREQLARDLIESLLRKAVVARSWEPPIANDLDSPCVQPLVRELAREHGYLICLHHRRHSLDDALRELVPAMDGTRDLAALAELLGAAVDAGRLELLDDRGRPGVLEDSVLACLRTLERLPALIGQS